AAVASLTISVLRSKTRSTGIASATPKAKVATCASEGHLFTNKSANIWTSGAVDGQPSAVSTISAGTTISTASAVSAITVKRSWASGATVSAISATAAYAT